MIWTGYIDIPKLIETISKSAVLNCLSGFSEENDGLSAWSTWPIDWFAKGTPQTDWLNGRNTLKLTGWLSDWLTDWVKVWLTGYVSQRLGVRTNMTAIKLLFTMPSHLQRLRIWFSWVEFQGAWKCDYICSCYPLINVIFFVFFLFKCFRLFVCLFFDSFHVVACNILIRGHLICVSSFLWCVMIPCLFCRWELWV